MSRLEVKMPGQAQAVVEQLYRNMERRIAASPPGLCPVDMALNFITLCQAQTCGKCVPCRIGLTQISNMLRQVLDGEPDISILKLIEATAQVIVDTADCAIGIDADLVYSREKRRPRAFLFLSLVDASFSYFA